MPLPVVHPLVRGRSTPPPFGMMFFLFRSATKWKASSSMIWCSEVTSSLTVESAIGSSVGNIYFDQDIADSCRRADDAQFGLRNYRCRATKDSHARRANRRDEKIPAAGNAQLTEDRRDLIFRRGEFGASLARYLSVCLSSEHAI